MKVIRPLLATCLFFVSLNACGSQLEDMNMFIARARTLIQAPNMDEEEQALGELLTATRQTNVNYGYRVFNKTKDKRVMPDELDSVIEDDLIVTIFVGEKAPYQEFVWRPKYNGHITRLVIP